MMVSHSMLSEGSKVTNVQQRSPALALPTRTEISLDCLNLFTTLYMVVGEKHKVFAILHREM